MLKERARWFTRINVVLDILSTSLSLLFAFWIRYSIQPVPHLSELFARYLSILYVALPLWYLLFRLHGKYDSHRLKTLAPVAGVILRSVAEGIALLVLIGYFMRTENISRSFLLLFGLINAGMLIAQQALLKQMLNRIRYQGYNFRRVLIVGTGKEAEAVAEKIRLNREWGLHVSGFVAPHPGTTDLPQCGIRPVGELQDLERILSSNPIDEVHIAVPSFDLQAVRHILKICEEQGVRVRLLIDLHSPVLTRIHLEEFQGTPMLTFTSAPAEGWGLLVKETLDRLGSLALLLLFTPLFALFAILIKLNSRGPVFFIQERVGLNKRRFRICKFRTMLAEAEEMKAALLCRNDLTGPAFKMRNDPRCTSVGRVLRKLSLDELPQLVNVLKGEMSFVGPRPSVPEEVAQYHTWQYRRLSMKPGITGLWQVSGRNDVDFQRWIELDLRYIDTWSLKSDLVIFLKTFPAVLLGKGAF